MAQTALNLDLAAIDVLCVYGTDRMEEVYAEVSTWLQEADTQRFLVFIVEGWMEGQTVHQDPRVRRCVGTAEAFTKIAWEFVWLRFGYYPEESSAAQECFKQLEQTHSAVDLIASDSRDMGALVLSNTLANLHHLPRAKQFNSLKGALSGIPAILCGAGPSLNTAIPHLKAFHNKALIIGGGSSVAALNAQGVFPHLYANIDPDPPYRRFLAQDMHTQPFFYQNRLASSLLQMVSGLLVWMPGSGSYPLEEWLLLECGIAVEPLESGWTVANLLALIAHHLGCDPILCVGMDFSCRQGEIYASKIAGEENQDSLIALDAPGLYSKRDWLLSAEWMGEFALKHPERRWMNATEGGVELKGFERCGLADVLTPFPTRDIEGSLHSALHTAPFVTVTSETIAEIKHKLFASIEATSTYCEQLLKVWEKYYPASPLDKAEYILLDVELEQEVCFLQVLQPLWEVWKWPMLRSVTHPLEQQLHRLLFFRQALKDLKGRAYV